MHTILDILNLSTDYLKQKGIERSRRQAEELLSEALGIARMDLYLQFDRPLIDLELERCRNWLKRRGQGEPLSYISGNVEFLGCSLKVTQDVLIPRQETEILAERITEELSTLALDGKVLWDVCCGSGCLGIAIKNRLPALSVALSDISKDALNVAKENALRNEVIVEFFEGDLLNPFIGRKADFFICNPPYIAAREIPTLDVEVRKHEPLLALDGGDSGLDFYRRLALELPNFLNPRGKVWMEIGTGQGKAVKELFQASCWKECNVELDWSGHERFFSLEIE